VSTATAEQMAHNNLHIDGHSVAPHANAFRVVAPNVPFGGFGSSGIGRENGADAIRDYTATKSIWVELSGQTRDPFTLG
jgi:acyl-CoA reductase-like NAD-dependent aldehyde dehydrogenase